MIITQDNILMVKCKVMGSLLGKDKSGIKFIAVHGKIVNRMDSVK